MVQGADVLHEIGLAQQLAADRGTAVYVTPEGGQLVIDGQPTTPSLRVDPDGQVHLQDAPGRS